MDGILLIDKPAGWTSHDVVTKVRSILRHQAKNPELKVPGNPLARESQLSARGSKIRVGHTGTLDPMATGLMLLVLGKYTKRAGEFSKLDKTYEAELTLGATSSTGDAEGEVKIGDRGEGIGDSKPSLKEVEATLQDFKGNIEQTPPAYSAIKINGQRAYKMARKGLTPDIKPRKVTVYRLQLTEYKYPKVKIITEVSSGTYIRTLAEDIGKELGTGAYLSALRRIKVGNFKLENSLKTNELDIYKIQQALLNHP